MTAAQLLKKARTDAGLTQQELADRSGFPQSTISAYESSRREPGFDAFARIISAAGYAVRLGEQSRLEHVRSKRVDLIREFDALGARNIRIFGSVARGDDGPDSDVDLLVDLDAGVSLIAMAGMRTAAEAILGRTVDIVPTDGLRASIREEVERDCVPL